MLKIRQKNSILCVYMLQINVDGLPMMLYLMLDYHHYYMMIHEIMVHIHYLFLVLLMNRFEINEIFQEKNILLYWILKLILQ